MLIQYIRENDEAKRTLANHNKETRFNPKHKDGEVLIPYITHHIWLTSAKEPKDLPELPHLWRMIAELGKEAKDGIEWKHVFWTNHVASVQLDGKACGGRCEVKPITDIEGYDMVEDTVRQMIDI